MAFLHESSVINIHSAAISLCLAIIDILFIYCPIVIILLKKRSLCFGIITIYSGFHFCEVHPREQDARTKNT
ncbi:MAG: hypothetical protein F6K39_19885 [Okeania sp. SIO3B3]|nr:hypothetical protein [Okeania sp. SIO3B3]